MPPKKSTRWPSAPKARPARLKGRVDAGTRLQVVTLDSQISSGAGVPCQAAAPRSTARLRTGSHTTGPQRSAGTAGRGVQFAMAIQAPPMSSKPELQVRVQAPPRQLAVPFCRGQGVQEAPQLSTESSARHEAPHR